MAKAIPARRSALHHVALNLDICLSVTGLGNLIGGLHAKKSIHLRAESLLNPQRHVGRERGAAVEKADSLRFISPTPPPAPYPATAPRAAPAR